jgi:HK97 family phage portal protein
MSIFDRFARKEKRTLVIPYWEEGRPSYPTVNFETMVSQGWKKNELIYACIDRTARTATQVATKIVDKDGNEVEDNPLRLLLSQPNPYMAEYDFWQAVIIYLNLAGIAYFEKERSNAGNVVGLWPMRPDWTAPVKSSQEFIKAYEYHVPGREKIYLDPKDVLVFKNYDPLNLYNGFAPVVVAARVGDIDNAETDFIKMFWEHGGVPSGLITTTQHLNEAQVELIRKRWGERYGGFKNWIEPAVLDVDAKYERTGLTFDEMGFETLDDRNEARICMVMNVPPIIVGAAVGLKRSTYSNYGEARKSWWQDTLIGLYEHFDDVINLQLAPEFGDVLMKFDYSQVPALQEDMNTEWQRYLQAVQAGIITVNEFRDGVGLPAINGGDVLLRQLSVYEQTVSVKSVPDAHEGKQLESKDLRLEDERKMTKKLTNFLEDELDRVIDEVGSEYGKKSIFTDDFWFAEAEALKAVLRGLLKGISTAASKRALDELLGTGAPISISWTQVNQAVNLWADQFVGERIKMITDSTKRMVQDKVIKWNNSGEPLKSLVKDLEGEFGKVRAERIAVTEVTNAYGQANLITWQSSGVVDKKRWYGIGDELLCPICSTLIGQEVALNDYFVDGMGGMYEAPAAHVNCRCWMQPVVNKV